MGRGKAAGAGTDQRETFNAKRSTRNVQRSKVEWGETNGAPLTSILSPKGRGDAWGGRPGRNAVGDGWGGRLGEPSLPTGEFTATERRGYMEETTEAGVGRGNSSTHP